ncbi:stage V sporulation protein B [Fictibacillus sp. KIGAM418]|uniref:Stage V sporulation protein B n=1 Tax=Fictibacillus marinisediminis TaxID=2878389 RepID=A0A9X1XD59_9BACL|nr:stage V sporulation protein B [Fictibacillus marinisediminis]MCK6258423.1 stage V sporulation protein B [Fictibacillus marinisediminis]
MGKFLKGTLILSLAMLYTKVVEFVVSVLLARSLGSEGMGFYMMALPVIGLLITIAALEFPTALSKVLAEEEVHQNDKQRLQIVKVSFYVIMGLSLLLVLISAAVTLLLLKWETIDTRLGYPLLALIPIVPVIGTTSILKGYFSGLQKMKPIAIAQLLEKTAQLSFIFYVLQYMKGLPLEYRVVAAVLGIGAGELVSLFFFSTSFLLGQRNLKDVSKSDFTPVPRRSILKKLFQVSLPTTGVRILNALTAAVNPILITQSLMFAGITASIATKQYGMLTAFAMTIGYFPGFIGYSLYVSLVPSISEARSKQDEAGLHQRIHQAFHITFLYGIPCSIVMYFFADELTVLFYHSPQAGQFLMLLSPFILFHYLLAPLQAILFGLGRARDVFSQTIWVNILSILLILSLASQTSFGIHGVIIAVNFSGVLLSFLHYHTIVEEVKFKPKLAEYFTFIASGVATICLCELMHTTHYENHQSITLLLIVVFSFYYGTLFLLRMLQNGIGRLWMKPQK